MSQSILQVFAQEAYRSVAMAIVRYVQSRPKKAIPRTVDDVDGIKTTFNCFLQAIVNQEISNALAQCSPEYRRALGQGPALDAALGLLRSNLVGFTEVRNSAVEFDSEHSRVRVTLEFVYAGGGTVPATFDLIRQADGWKITECQVAAHSTALTATELSLLAARMVAKMFAAHSTGRHAPEPSAPTLPPTPYGYPIKGSRTGIYHMPGGRFYGDTRPVLCFSSETQAKAAQYRASQKG